MARARDAAAADALAGGDAAWRTLRNAAIWRLFLFSFVTLAFAVAAGKRFWDMQVARQRMDTAGRATQPALAAPLRFEVQQARFEAALFLAAAAVMAVAAFFAYRRFDRLRRDVRMLLGRCMKCGYALEGLSEPRCPECGTAFKLTDDRQAPAPPPWPESRPP